MRIDAEWDAIRAKIAGTDVAFRHSRVSCVVATLDLDENGVAPGGWADAGVDDSLDPSCYANVAPDGSNARRVVLGTLDVNQGVSLPAEELAGQFPRAEDPTPADVDVREDGRGTNGPKPGEWTRRHGRGTRHRRRTARASLAGSSPRTRVPTRWPL